jgi:hypothetical protein
VVVVGGDRRIKRNATLTSCLGQAHGARDGLLELAGRYKPVGTS